jgi:hypothetical protein
MPKRETPLAMAQRHVLEAEDRLARQEALVRQMEQVHLSAILPLGRNLLEIMRTALASARSDLERLERQ